MKTASIGMFTGTSGVYSDICIRQMRGRNYLLLILIVFAAVLAFSQRRDAHVVVVSIDGLAPEYYLHPDDYGIQMPNLRRFWAGGSWAWGVQSQYPSVTYPAHPS